jgi:hypothetical protein
LVNTIKNKKEKYMSFYVLPKFKVNQTIFTIDGDKLKPITVEAIHATSADIGYLSENRVFSEKQSFATEEDAKTFLEQAVRLPFIKGDKAWEGNLTGVRSVEVKEVYCFFKDDFKKPYCATTHTDTCLNATGVFASQIEATEESLRAVKEYYKK